MKTEPLVSICCITYNHEDFIKDSIEGFLMQRTTFPIEIIIHDDASTDRTAEIIQEYARQHPDLFITILQKENQYSQGIRPFPNFVFPRARGKYIALCEGDDYWIDPLKLQKQVDFLEKHQEYSLIYANENTKNNTNIHLYINKAEPYEFTFLNSCQKKQGSTLTIVFRNNEEYLQILKKTLSSKAKMSDWQLECILTIFGKGYYIPDKVAFYRTHSSGQSKKINLDDFFFSRIDFFTRINNLELPINKKINKCLITRLYLLQATYKLQNKLHREAWICLKKSSKHLGLIFFLSFNNHCISDFKLRKLVPSLLKVMIKVVTND